MAEAAPLEGEYDTIVVGAGTAGCTLANRLTADATRSCCWKPAAWTTGYGSTFRSAISMPSATRASTGATAPKRCPGSTGVP